MIMETFRTRLLEQEVFKDLIQVELQKDFGKYRAGTILSIRLKPGQDVLDGFTEDQIEFFTNRPTIKK